MMNRRFLIVTAVLLGTSATAHAKTLSSATIYAGPQQVTGACVVRNVGSSAVSLTNKKIVEGNGGVALPLTDGCPAQLPGGQTCSVFADVSTPDQGHACSVDVTGAGYKNVRAVFELRDSSQSILEVIELH